MKKKYKRKRRLLAALIDFFLHVYSAALFVVLSLLLPFFDRFIILFTAIATIGCFVTFILRDYLFQGRSIGKRILKLRVVDEETLSKPSAKQLIVKNLFLFIYPFDAFILIFSGKSIGERVSHTTVLREQQLPCTDSSEESAQSKLSVKRCIAVAAAAILCISIPLFLLISSSLNTAEEQENCQIAYSYLLNSQAFDEIQGEESQITLIGFSSSTRIYGNDDPEATVAAFTFLVRGQQYRVVCHKNGQQWYVCSECTKFR